MTFGVGFAAGDHRRDDVNHGGSTARPDADFVFGEPLYRLQGTLIECPLPLILTDTPQELDACRQPITGAHDDSLKHAWNFADDGPVLNHKSRASEGLRVFVRYRMIG